MKTSNKVSKIGNLYRGKKHQSGDVYSIGGCSPTLCSGCHSYGIPFVLIGENMQKMVRLGNIYGEQFGTGFAGNVWDKDGIIPSLMTAQGGGELQ